MKIAVFCGAKSGNDTQYETIAFELGQEIARRGHTLIYGGGNKGLMGKISEGSIVGNGKVLGFFPRFLEPREGINTNGVEMTYMDTMDQRKVCMFQESDAVIVLPGGFGTMDEFFEVLTLRQLGQYDKPIGILDINGFYQPMMHFLHNMVDEGFVSVEHLELFFMRESISDLLDTMEI